MICLRLFIEFYKPAAQRRKTEIASWRKRDNEAQSERERQREKESAFEFTFARR